jgi:purine-binding chemotaxis protein CheW
MSSEETSWSEIHSRIEAVNAAIEKGFSPSIEEKKKVLKARADLLALEPEKEREDEQIEVVEFLLLNEHYGIESHYIREVYPIKDFTPLPCTPPFVFGLINVRGQIISVIDIKKFFDMPEKGISDLNKVIIIHDEKMEFGILADSVAGVRKIAVSEIEPPLPTLTGIREEFLRGVTGERMVILDAKRLLTDKNIIVHEEA